MPRLSTLVALAVVGWGVDLVVRRHLLRMSARPEAQPQPLQTWEGEGGGVPVSRHATTASRVRSDDLLSPGSEV